MYIYIYSVYDEEWPFADKGILINSHIYIYTVIFTYIFTCIYIFEFLYVVVKPTY